MTNRLSKTQCKALGMEPSTKMWGWGYGTVGLIWILEGVTRIAKKRIARGIQLLTLASNTCQDLEPESGDFDLRRPILAVELSPGGT